MEIAVPDVEQSVGQRRQAFTNAIVITALAALLISLFSTEAAIDGGLAARAIVPGRMLLLVVAATVLLRSTGETWHDVGLGRPPSLRRATTLIVVGYGAIAVSLVIVTQLLLPALNIAPKTALTFAALRGDLGEYLYWLIPVAWGSAAIGEEMVFRGFLQTRLERLFGALPGATVLAVISQAFVFGSLHAYQGAGGAILAGMTGLIIGLVYVLGRRNLWTCIVLHGLIDTVSLTAIFMGATV